MSSYKDYPLSRDTTPEAENIYFELLAKKSPAEKLQMVASMNEAVRTLTLAGLRERHPGESKSQIKVRLAELLHGPAVAQIIAERMKNSPDNE